MDFTDFILNLRMNGRIGLLLGSICNYHLAPRGFRFVNRLGRLFLRVIVGMRGRSGLLTFLNPTIMGYYIVLAPPDDFEFKIAGVGRFALPIGRVPIA